MKLKPLHDRILVTRIEDKTQKKGGIVIPDSAKEKPMEGKVIAVGSGRVQDDGKKVPLAVKVGCQARHPVREGGSDGALPGIPTRSEGPQGPQGL